MYLEQTDEKLNLVEFSYGAEAPKATLTPARMPTQCILSLRTLNWTCLPPVCTKNIERRAKYDTFKLTYECGVRSHARSTTEETR